MNILQENLKKLFLAADESFRRENTDLFEFQVNERTLCGALMIHLNDAIRNSEFCGYKVDVEYNRNSKRKVKTFIHNDPDDPTGKEIKVNINCDLVVHGRGRMNGHENLIILEMKKAKPSGKITKDMLNDKYRLIALTKEANNGVWGERSRLSEHICDYQLGIYYEVDFKAETISLEYYIEGIMVDTDTYSY